MSKTNIDGLVEKMKRSWPSPFVARLEVGRFSGGLLHPRTMANLDAKGEGPQKITLGTRNVAYERDSLIDWMMLRMKIDEGVASKNPGRE